MVLKLATTMNLPSDPKEYTLLVMKSFNFSYNSQQFIILYAKETHILTALSPFLSKSNQKIGWNKNVGGIFPKSL